MKNKKQYENFLATVFDNNEDQIVDNFHNAELIEDFEDEQKFQNWLQYGFYEL